jgi:hypothetical protein
MPQVGHATGQRIRTVTPNPLDHLSVSHSMEWAADHYEVKDLDFVMARWDFIVETYREDPEYDASRSFTYPEFRSMFEAR